MYPRSDRAFILATDAATGVGIGACLKQVDDDGVERVVSYHGRRFNKAERNYTVTECELLAVIEAVKNFRPYLWGRRFRLVTDHMALKWLHTMKETVAGGLSSRLTRWTLRLQEHDFEVEHKPICATRSWHSACPTQSHAPPLAAHARVTHPAPQHA